MLALGSRKQDKIMNITRKDFVQQFRNSTTFSTIAQLYHAFCKKHKMQPNPFDENVFYDLLRDEFGRPQDNPDGGPLVGYFLRVV